MKVFLASMILAGFAIGSLWARPTETARACGDAGAFDFDTFESENYTVTYARAIELATAGKAITSAYSLLNANETIDVRYQGLLKGSRLTRSAAPDANAPIPPSVYKSIAWIEANWNNASGSVPFGGVGPVVVSFDCGYGLGQVTTGMTNTTGTATARQAAIGTHFLFNIAEGVRILADKWNSAPRYRPLAGTGDPSALEDWYYAIWSYNGFAFSNHPLNPMRDPLRGGGTSRPFLFHCDDPAAPSFGGGASAQFKYSDFTYQERVYGCMQYPPQRAPVGAPGGTPKTRIWQPQLFNMPNFAEPVIASAFDPKNFTDCEDAGFAGGCSKMDFPTAYIPAQAPPPTPTPTPTGSATPTPTGSPTPTATATATPRVPPTPVVPVVTHRDNTSPVDPAIAATLLGAPVFTFSGPTAATLSVQPGGTVESATITVKNTGTGILPFRVRTSAAWITVRHPGDDASRTLDGGVAIGAEVQVVTQSPTAGPPSRPRLFQLGYQSQLIITLVPGRVPAGTTQGSVWIEPLFGSGTAVQIKITAMSSGDPLPYKVVAPGTASDAN